MSRMTYEIYMGWSGHCIYRHQKVGPKTIVTYLFVCETKQEADEFCAMLNEAVK